MDVIEKTSWYIGLRIFIAIEPDERVRDALAKLPVHFKKSCYKRYVPSENFHISLFFLGEIGNNTINLVKKCMDKIEGSGYKIIMDSVGCFYRNRMPSIFFAKGKSEGLSIMRENLRNCFVDNNICRSNKSFEAHVTLFRVKKIYDINRFNDELIDCRKEFKTISFDVKEIGMYSSVLSSSGAIYNKIYNRALM